MPLAAAAVPAQVPAKENASGPASAKESTSEPEVVDPALQRLTDGITKVTEVVSVLTHIRPSASVQYARAARSSLLCAVRTEGSGQLAAGGPLLYVRDTRTSPLSVPYVPQVVRQQKKGAQNITVAVRVRPLTKAERDRHAYPTTKVLDHEHVLVSDPDDKMGGLLCQEHARGGMAGQRGPSG